MREVVAILKSGGVIIYPTDTAYALGCDATNQKAVEKIFKIKGREASKTLPLIAADAAMVREWAELSEKAEGLAKEYWPGPLTLVLPVAKEGLAQSVIKDDCIAIRVPKHETSKKLSAELGGPIVSTSANTAGKPTCYSVESVKESLGESFELIEYSIDEGELPALPVSTMVKVWDNNVTIIREGAIAIVV